MPLLLKPYQPILVFPRLRMVLSSTKNVSLGLVTFISGMESSKYFLMSPKLASDPSPKTHLNISMLKLLHTAYPEREHATRPKVFKQAYKNVSTVR